MLPPLLPEAVVDMGRLETQEEDLQETRAGIEGAQAEAAGETESAHAHSFMSRACSTASAQSRQSQASVSSRGSSLLQRRQFKMKTLELGDAKVNFRQALEAQGYTIGAVLGRSSVNNGFAVFHAERAGKPLAAKCTSETKSDGTLSRVLLNEFKILKSLEHPNIVQALHFVEALAGAALVEERCAGCRLDLLLPQDSALCLRKRRCVLERILSAVAYMHSKDVAHMDLHCQNVVVDAGERDKQAAAVKVLDFGSARVGDLSAASGGIQEEFAILDATDRRFSPPGGRLGSLAQCDVFGYGLLAAALAAGRLVHTADVIKDGALSLPALNFPARAADAVWSALSVVPDHRPSAEELSKALPSATQWVEALRENTKLSL